MIDEIFNELLNSIKCCFVSQKVRRSLRKVCERRISRDRKNLQSDGNVIVALIIAKVTGKIQL